MHMVNHPSQAVSARRECGTPGKMASRMLMLWIAVATNSWRTGVADGKRVLPPGTTRVRRALRRSRSRKTQLADRIRGPDAPEHRSGARRLDERLEQGDPLHHGGGQSIEDCII